MKKLNFLILLLLVHFIGCSSSTESTKDNSQDNGQEIYVFDDVVNDDTLANSNDSIDITSPAQIDSTSGFIVQVGAFSTKDKAEKFVNLNQSKIEWQMKISFSNSVDLFVVQLPVFSSRLKAETVRDKLWKMKEFNDAFVLNK